MEFTRQEIIDYIELIGLWLLTHSIVLLSCWTQKLMQN